LASTTSALVDCVPLSMPMTRVRATKLGNHTAGAMGSLIPEATDTKSLRMSIG
jgi:hypothetical protein